MDSGRGGEREGAGRPTGTTKDNNRVQMTISLPHKQTKYLASCGVSPGRIIERALDDWMEKLDKNNQTTDNTKN